MEIGPIAIVVAVISGLASFFVARWLSRSRREKKAKQRQATAQATETRQVRRARQRRGG